VEGEKRRSAGTSLPSGGHAQTAALPLQTEIVLHRLLAHLTLWQCQMLVDHLDRVLMGGGYGEVAIVMEKGHTRRLRVTISADITPVTELAKQEKPHGQT